MEKKYLKRLIIILAISLLFTSCEKYDKRTYYNVKGVGYVYYKDSKKPVPGAQVIVQSSFGSNGWGPAILQPIQEYFSADSSGYFCVKFLKRTERENVISYSIGPSKENYYSTATKLSAEELQSIKNIIKIDTLWLYPIWTK
jgi:hypothetical protein